MYFIVLEKGGLKALSLFRPRSLLQDADYPSADFQFVNAAAFCANYFCTTIERTEESTSTERGYPTIGLDARASANPIDLIIGKPRTTNRI